MAIVAIPILPVGSVSGNQFRANRLIEKSAQTFKSGTVVSIAAADGGVQAWDVATLTGAQGSPIGVAYEAASNLSATGSGAPSPLTPFLGVGAVQGTVANVPNQSSAKTIFHGAPANDGRVGFIVAVSDTVFSATFGNNGNTATPLATDVGIAYGLTLDTAANFFYVDKNKTGASSAVRVVQLDLRDSPAGGTRVLFVFLPTVVNLIG